jgi:hypothetical protein
VPLLLVLAPALGRVPAYRDLVDYFAPMRAFTSSSLAAGVVPWLNPGNGCGEAWFANPQTGVLYPPHWLHLALPADWALTLEVALHLALLSLGVGRLARHWGSDRWGRMCAEVAAWAAGPVLVTVGVLNNLETLAWIPWLVLAAMRRDRASVPLTALCTAMAWLGGEPQLCALGALLAVAAAPRRGFTVVAVGLGLALVAVQLVPFTAWVVEGDRQPGTAAYALEGAVEPSAWWGVLVPGLPGAVGRGMVYAQSLFLGAPLLTCALLGTERRRWSLAVVLVLALVATLPALGAGSLYLLVTAGMLRYPARFALLALVVLLPFIGPGVRRWRGGEGSLLAAVLGGLSLLLWALLPTVRGLILVGVPALLLLVAAARPLERWLRDAAVVAGLVSAVVVGLPLLGLDSQQALRARKPTWPEARDGSRLYTPAAGQEVQAWLATGLRARRLWPVGYLNLDDGLTMARSFAPVAHRRLVHHLNRAERALRHRWWLDAVGARWLILPFQPAPEAMRLVRRLGGLSLYQNLRAQPTVTVASQPPQRRQPWQGVGSMVTLRTTAHRLSAIVSTRSRGWVWLSVPPLRGWRWWLDGEPVEPEQGPGIVQCLHLEPGTHRVEASYQPPALIAALVVSLAAVVVLCWLLWRSRVKVEVRVEGGTWSG